MDHKASSAVLTTPTVCWVLGLLQRTKSEEVKREGRGFPKNPPANAGDKPWSGKIPHAWGQLSPCATTTEAKL